MITEQKRKEYTKPGVKVVEWDFNETVCSATAGSYSKYISVSSGSGHVTTEQRENTTGTWTRVGSR